MGLARNSAVTFSPEHHLTGQIRAVRPLLLTTPPGGTTRFISNVNHPRDIPDFVLPDAPPYPCPFLTDEEIQTYLTPLYTRAWTVQPSNPQPDDESKAAPELVKTFTLSSTQELDEFLQKVDGITRSENHHAVLEKPVDSPAIVLRVHTHSGLRPASHPGERRKERVQPGITLRDVRFAQLVELALGDGAQAHHGAELTPSDIAAQPRFAEGVEARRYAGVMRMSDCLS